MKRKAISRTRLYCLAIFLIAIVCITLFLCVQSSLTPNNNSKSETIANVDLPTNNSLSDISEQNITSPTPTLPNENSTTITKEQALAIAMPIIEKYAKENNRTITNVTAQWEMSQYDGLSDGLTIPQVLAENLTHSQSFKKYSFYPVWTVVANFITTDHQIIPIYADNGFIIDYHWPSDSARVNGYEVTIWADNGQIASNHIQACR